MHARSNVKAASNSQWLRAYLKEEGGEENLEKTEIHKVFFIVSCISRASFILVTTNMRNGKYMKATELKLSRKSGHLTRSQENKF